MKRRKFEELFFRVLMVLATVFVAGSFFLIVGTIFYKGAPYMNLDMITKTPGGGFYIGKEGGILNAIVGSMYIAGGATILGLLISIPVAIYINMYMNGKTFLANTLRMAFDVLFGIPSIVYGAFGFLIMVYFGLRASLLGGIIAVTLLVIPILVRTLDEVIRTVPFELRDAALSLGATRWEMAKVVLRQIRPGIFTAILLSFGRAIGDVASVLFTAGFSDNIPTSLHEPAATLPLAIFFQLSSPVEEVQGRGYASALVLTIVVLIITVLSEALIKNFFKHKI
ncbi:phosphate ABC transporter permease PstA [Mucilaginibacter gotjawali]|uniref:Phosphate transport system permease protein PstA n=2 Tax=Mucilaginibacter gotjawali TaxID=1550579 RepID=A0A110B383_9SPHI|nr:phosphate ABC transporter permease PstA [Mucilaginibacter gotjawali]MBB3055776.1 phosphate transport system permease protein [Mucilaginibacter gotjawali]BAU54597.1 Phosphate transport system permease protein PstA [Mucilaginibacter gotjawali]